jgi:hypothetical protein
VFEAESAIRLGPSEIEPKYVISQTRQLTAAARISIGATMQKRADRKSVTGEQQRATRAS